MKNLKALLLTLLFLPFLMGCGGEEDISPDQSLSRLAETLLRDDPEEVGAEVNRLLQLHANLPEAQRLSKLIGQIDSSPALHVTGSCFGCIYTNPVQSEVVISVTSDNGAISRCVDLIHRESGLVFFKLHE